MVNNKENDCEEKLSLLQNKCGRYRKMLEKVYNILREEYPEGIEQEVIDNLGDLGQPYTILREIKGLLKE